MTVKRPNSVRALLGLVVLGCLGAGCGKKEEVAKGPSLDERHILHAAQLWSRYRSAHGGKMPGTVEELKAWAKQQKREELAKYGAEDVDKALTSPRDGQPYGVLRPMGNPMGMGNVVYEKTGVGGKRLVASNMGTVAELNEEAFKGAVKNAP